MYGQLDLTSTKKMAIATSHDEADVAEMVDDYLPFPSFEPLSPLPDYILESLYATTGTYQ
jgi:hypothetical protein